MTFLVALKAPIESIRLSHLLPRRIRYAVSNFHAISDLSGLIPPAEAPMPTL